VGVVTSGRFMLDTHVLLWALTDPSRLPPGLAGRVADRTERLVVSAASAWEIAIKHRLGKLPQAEVLVRGYQQHLDRLGVETIDITSEHSLLAGSMEWPHRDPFDRMIAAQCMIESLPLATSDKAFGSLRGVRILC
jgi:PIN domain nuclease of toxin-antitoxin system